MTQVPVRRAQLIAPFGVGAMLTSTDGTSMITASLDSWFDPGDGNGEDLDIGEFRVEEWRLEEALRVRELRLPPDYRTFSAGADKPKNLRINVPFLRFPAWHFCPACRALHWVAPHEPHRRRCPSCEAKSAEKLAKGPRRAPYLVQVPFIAICDHGHLQDFPWREWVHRRADPSCDRQMYLKASGGASLASQVVSCECGVEKRNLAQITEAFEDPENEREDTFLSTALQKGSRFDCRGVRPWMGDMHRKDGEGCGRPLRGSLRAATNVYFAHVESAIYLPGGTYGLAEGLVELLQEPPLRDAIEWARSLELPVNASMLKKGADAARLLARFSNEDVDKALGALEEMRAAAASNAPSDDRVDPEAIRQPEFKVLREPIDTDHLRIRALTVDTYDLPVKGYFARVNLIDRLRETRVLYGLSRVKPDTRATLSERKASLWRAEPQFEHSWLPAYVVHGEGLYLELNPMALAEWESRDSVRKRVERLASNPARIDVQKVLGDPAVVPRFVLLHTLAHLLINQLVFDCGYSSASLRERIYCSAGDQGMAGMLIYTAAGDSEGTMGGLVRMGRPQSLEPVLVAALDNARWCSSDPVCMELGAHGQGPGAMNLAACHSCGLLPETACECFNKLLDRALVTGGFDEKDLGFFGEVL